MRILVTGARGFVGRGLLPMLAAKGHTGIATGRDAPDNLPAGWIAARRDDVLEGLHAPEAIDAIVHLEVKQHVFRPTAVEVADFHRVNVEGTRQWTDWATKQWVRHFVHMSTVKAASGGPGIHGETDPPNPDSPYGRSKAAGEDVVRRWSEAGVNRVATILRPAPVYGPGNQANLAAFVRQVLAGRRCFVGDGGVRKSLVGRNNLAAATMFLIEQDSRGCEVFNVSDTEVPTVKELACLIAELAECPAPRGMPLAVAKFLAPVGDVICRIAGVDFPLNSARLRAIQEESIFPCNKLVAAGFRHPWSLRRGMAEMVSWATTSDTA